MVFFPGDLKVKFLPLETTSSSFPRNTALLSLPVMPLSKSSLSNTNVLHSFFFILTQGYVY